MSASYKFAPNIIVAPGTNDAKNWETNRTIDHGRFERETLAALDAIWQGSWTGTGIIQGIAEKSGYRVIITPHNVRECNAQSDPFPKWGSGGEINVQFLPSTWQNGSACATGPSAAPDVVLLHELVHAYRQIHGHVITVSLNVPGFNYENKEEFYAILLANIHMSAKGQTVLRKDHKDHTRLYPELSTSGPFLRHYREHRQLVHDLLCDHYSLCQFSVRKDQGAFNPIDFFLKNSAEMVELQRRKPDPPSSADLESRRLMEEMIEQKILGGGVRQPAHR